MRQVVLSSLLLLTPPAILGQPVAAPAFEVASVKLHPLPQGAFGFGPGNAIRIAGNRITLDRNTLTGLVMTAYNVKDFQISGMPEWTRNREQLYDITAKTEGEAATTVDLVRPMLQTLLADRFQLKLHRETKELPVYNLMIDKKGMKFKESAGARPSKPVTFSGLLIGLNLLDRSMADLVLLPVTSTVPCSTRPA
jgi:uncharacterized protein (TIGR03435 family)